MEEELASCRREQGTSLTELNTCRDYDADPPQRHRLWLNELNCWLLCTLGMHEPGLTTATIPGCKQARARCSGRKKLRRARVDKSTSSPYLPR